MYAFAIIMWEVFTQKTPYYEIGDYHKIVKYVYIDDGRPNLKDVKSHVDEQVLKLIEKNWDRDTDNRMEFREIIPILEKLLKKALENPSIIGKK